MGLQARIRSECQAGRDKQYPAWSITRLSQETREFSSDIKSSRGLCGICFGNRGRLTWLSQAHFSTRLHIHFPWKPLDHDNQSH